MKMLTLELTATHGTWKQNSTGIIAKEPACFPPAQLFTQPGFLAGELMDFHAASL
jgi:hypothetical protein